MDVEVGMACGIANGTKQLGSVTPELRLMRKRRAAPRTREAISSTIET